MHFRVGNFRLRLGVSLRMRGRTHTPERAQPARAIALKPLYLLEFPCITIGNRTAVLLNRCFISGESISKYLRISPQGTPEGRSNDVHFELLTPY